MEQLREHQNGFGTRTYLAAWAALLLLLALTVAAAKVRTLPYGVVINLLIASVKAAIVLFFFMHLAGAGRFIRWMLFLTLSTLTAVIALTFSDTWYR